MVIYFDLRNERNHVASNSKPIKMARMTRCSFYILCVDKMRKEGMIQKTISRNNHFHNLDPEMLNKPFNFNNDYSVPYIWGATAIGVNRAMLSIQNHYQLG